MYQKLLHIAWTKNIVKKFRILCVFLSFSKIPQPLDRHIQQTVIHGNRSKPSARELRPIYLKGKTKSRGEKEAGRDEDTRHERGERRKKNT